MENALLLKSVDKAYKQSNLKVSIWIFYIAAFVLCVLVITNRANPIILFVGLADFTMHSGFQLHSLGCKKVAFVFYH